MRLGAYVSSAVRDLGLRLDARGLLPLAEARRRVRAAKVFERGKSHKIPNQASQPTDGDFLWAALLSLDDAKEFVREASRITWKFSPRGFDNIAPLERFGDAILPWLAHFIDEDGKLSPNPWCVIPCLTGMGDDAALKVILGIRSRSDIHELVRAWLAQHGRRGWRALAALASKGHARANEILLSEVKRSPTGARRALVSAIGERKATALLFKSAAPPELTAAAILEVLDAAASAEVDDPMPWPARGASVGHFEPHAMRVIAARSKTGDAWGILFEVVQGDILQAPDDEIRWPATIQQYRYGSQVPAGGRYLVDARPIGMHRMGDVVVGPKGTKSFTLSDALVKKLRLEPRRSCSKQIEDWPSVLAVRARLERDPDAFWSDPRALAMSVLAIENPVVLVATDRFEHVDGRLPSAAKTFRSLAEAIARRDAKRFHPGKPNVDWRGQRRT